ncbi:MAG: hypothetical protein KDB02_01490 [Acidimicrobiales bacterium]|nr:hypothetical protein [Acidimicrobiales bacterium]
MATSSFRDRFFTKPVAHALTSPSGILAAGAGAAVGIVATAPLSIPLAVVGGLVGGALGLGGRLLAAMPKAATKPRIDPFQVQEPWRGAVIDALEAKVRFDQAADTFRQGPLDDAVDRIASQLDAAIEECWQVARQGDTVAQARKRISDRDISNQLTRLRGSLNGAEPNEVQARTIEALESQSATARRLDQILSDTSDRLALLNARLDESVTQAIELSVGAQGGDASTIGTDLGGIVEELQTLRVAMEDVRGTDTPAPGTS